MKKPTNIAERFFQWGNHQQGDNSYDFARSEFALHPYDPIKNIVTPVLVRVTVSDLEADMLTIIETAARKGYRPDLPSPTNAFQLLLDTWEEDVLSASDQAREFQYAVEGLHPIDAPRLPVIDPTLSEESLEWNQAQRRLGEYGVKPGTMQAQASELREAKKRTWLLKQEVEILRRATACLSPASLPR